MNQDYEDMRYVYFTQEEMDWGQGEINPFRAYSEIDFCAAESAPAYVYELVEVVLPKGAEDQGDEKRPIKVTYV